MNLRAAPGIIRDSIINYLTSAENASLAEIREAISTELGSTVAASSIRSYLNLNTPDIFERTSRGHYRLHAARGHSTQTTPPPEYVIGRARLVQSNCFDWLRTREVRSIHSVITDPPYGLLEYSAIQQTKLRRKRGGVWRIPPSFDGHQRAPLPRFTVLNDGDRALLYDFFFELGHLLLRVTVPGANVLVASNPLLVHIVTGAMSSAGLELRGQIIRLVMTMRGGDRPKNAHTEFSDVSVMPRSMFEPWIVLRHPSTVERRIICADGRQADFAEFHSQGRSEMSSSHSQRGAQKGKLRRIPPSSLKRFCGRSFVLLCRSARESFLILLPDQARRSQRPMQWAMKVSVSKKIRNTSKWRRAR